MSTAGRIESRPNEPQSTIRRLVLYAVGVALLAGAIWIVVRQADGSRDALEAAAQAPPWLLVLGATLPLANWLSTSGVFWRLTARHGAVSFREMAALIGAAWLLNHLPMRPGLVGRVAYHKSVHGIPVRTTAAVLVQAVAATGVSAALCLTGVALASGLGVGAWAALPLIAAPCVAAPIAARLASRSVDAPRELFCAFADATALRTIDLVVWGVRYFVVFQIIGEPIGVAHAALIALASQAAMLLPIQVGPREWAVALAWSLAPSWLRESGVSDAQDLVPGLLVDMLNRVGELAWVIPIGLCSIWWLWRRRRAVSSENNANSRVENSPTSRT